MTAVFFWSAYILDMNSSRHELTLGRVFREYLCTIKQEIKYIWPAPWSIAKILFLLNRYLYACFSIPPAAALFLDSFAARLLWTFTGPVLSLVLSGKRLVRRGEFRSRRSVRLQYVVFSGYMRPFLVLKQLLPTLARLSSSRKLFYLFVAGLFGYVRFARTRDF